MVCQVIIHNDYALLVERHILPWSVSKMGAVLSHFVSLPDSEVLLAISKSVHLTQNLRGQEERLGAEVASMATSRTRIQGVKPRLKNIL